MNFVEHLVWLTARDGCLTGSSGWCLVQALALALSAGSSGANWHEQTSNGLFFQVPLVCVCVPLCINAPSSLSLSLSALTLRLELDKGERKRKMMIMIEK